MLFGPMANKNTHADLYGMVFTLTWKLQGSLKCFQSHCFNLDLRCSFHSLFDRNMIFKELPFFNSGFIHLILFFILSNLIFFGNQKTIEMAVIDLVIQRNNSAAVV